MEFLKAEIERKKRQMQEKGVMAGPDKKYFKRGDLAEKQREEYLAKHSPKSDAATKSEEIKVNTEKGKIKRYTNFTYKYETSNTGSPICYIVHIFL